jgi:hypothetical protein
MAGYIVWRALRTLNPDWSYLPTPLACSTHLPEIAV